MQSASAVQVCSSAVQQRCPSLSLPNPPSPEWVVVRRSQLAEFPRPWRTPFSNECWS